MKTTFFIATNLDEISSVIKILKRTKKDMKKVSKGCKSMVKVHLKEDHLSELEHKGIKYSKEISFD